MVQLIADIVANPQAGTFIGNNCYKIRLCINSKGKGKSGGHVSSLISTLKPKLFICLLFTTKAKKPL
jgi:hypothetical protein